MIKFQREQVATAIAVLFHCIGLAGILFSNKAFFIASTPVNLLLMFVLVMWTQREKNKFFFLFMVSVFLLGFFAEVAGVKTGVLFGQYGYGKVLGFKWQQVPLLIGINWVIIIYCCGISTQTLLLKAIDKVSEQSKEPPLLLKALSVIMDGATLAVLFDWLMEPVAIKLGFWQWKGDGSVPIYNYLCWFLVSTLMLTIFHFCTFNKQNKFAVNLLLIQFMFFLLLRTFL